MTALGHGQVWWADLDEVRPVVVLTRASIADRLYRVARVLRRHAPHHRLRDEPVKVSIMMCPTRTL